MDIKTSIVKDTISKDIDLFLSKKNNVINKNIGDLLYLLELNNSPMTKILIDSVKKNKLILIYDEELVNSSIRYFPNGSSVLINVSKFAKLKKLPGGEVKFVLSQDQLYALLIGGYVTLNHDTLVYNRDYLNDVAMLYLELIPKIFTKGGDFFVTEEKISKFHFLMLFFYFSVNKTVVRNPEGYASRISEIRQEDLNFLKASYPLDKVQNMNFEQFHTTIIQEEFKFAKELNLQMLIYNATLIYGADNISLIDNMSVIGTIMVDCIIGNRPTLNASNSVFKNLVKSSMYNNILSVLGEVR